MLEQMFAVEWELELRELEWELELREQLWKVKLVLEWKEQRLLVQEFAVVLELQL